MSPATLSVRDGVAVVTMDDGKANAVSLTMQEAVNAALDEAERAGLPVVLTGRTGILSAGFDLKTNKTMAYLTLIGSVLLLAGVYLIRF